MTFGTANGGGASGLAALESLPRAMLGTISLPFSYLVNTLCDGLFSLCSSETPENRKLDLDILFPEVITLNYFDGIKYA